MELLRAYQERAVQEMLAQENHYNAYGLGLGKTRMMLEYLARSKKKAIIFAPLLVAQRTWPAEIKKWSYDFIYAIVHGAHKRSALTSEADILLIPYSSAKWVYDYGLKHGAKFLRDRAVIFDESTAFKRPASKRFKMLQAMQHLFKNGVFCLSGEPMPGGYKDLWSQYYILDRGAALGRTMSAYTKEFFIESGPPRWQSYMKEGAAETIQKLVAPLTSVMRSEDYVELPDVLVSTFNIQLNPQLMVKYNELKNNFVTTIDYHEIYAPSAGVLSTKLRMLAQGGIYINNARQIKVIHSEKAATLAELYASANGDPILCPVYFIFDVLIIREMLGYEVPVIAGGTSLEEKQRLLKEWDEGKIPLLLCHPASMSHGLNMQYGGHIIVWYSLPWSLEHYKQLNGRLIRPGQKLPVRIYHLSATNTIDQRIAQVLEQKDATQEQFKQAIIDSLTKEK